MLSDRRCVVPFQMTNRGYIVALLDSGIDLKPHVMTNYSLWGEKTTTYLCRPLNKKTNTEECE